MFDKDIPSFDDTVIFDESLRPRFLNLLKVCRVACEDQDPKKYKNALHQLHVIEEILWKLYMEVYHK